MASLTFFNDFPNRHGQLTPGYRLLTAQKAARSGAFRFEKAPIREEVRPSVGLGPGGIANGKSDMMEAKPWQRRTFFFAWAAATCVMPTRAAEYKPGQPNAVYGPPSEGISDAETLVPLDASGVPDTLAQAAALAVQNFPSVRAAESQIKASEEDIRAARWQRFPSASIDVFSSTGGRNADLIEPRFQLDQPIWAGGRISATIARARARRAVAQYELSETIFDIALRLTSAYYEIARAARLEAILQGSLSEHQRLVESMERRVAQEVSPQSDLELARSRLAQVQQELALLSAQRYSALQRFYELVGDPDFPLGSVPSYDPADHHPGTDGAIHLALSCEPAIQKLRAQVEVAEAERQLSRAAIFPQVGVQVAHDEITGTRAGLSIRAQTNGGLSAFAAADAAELRRQASELEVAVAERETRETLVLDIVENTSTRARITSSSAAADATGNVTDSFMRQFITGRRTWLDVMNAVREANAARVALAESEISAMSSAARIRLRTCRWRPELTRTVR